MALRWATFVPVILSLTGTSLSSPQIVKTHFAGQSDVELAGVFEHHLAKRATLSPATKLPTNWTYVGCYNDQQGTRTLSSYNTATQGNNASTCITFCASKNTVYAGTEYGDECYCGNQLAASATLYADPNCNMGCAGNSSEACGGSNFLTIYYANKAAPSGPITNPGPPGWKSYGCWTEGSSRTLSHAVTVPGGGSNMSVSACTTVCAGAGYSLAGIEYAGECYCSNYIDSSTATNTTLTDCNMPCNGNASEFCGAGNRLDLYAQGNTVPALKPASSVPPTPSGWTALGCYNDTNGRRALSQTQYLQASMTIEVCLAACQSNGYTYGGLEYAGECYCDTQIRQYSAAVTDGRCNMACNGNSNETCGGPNGLSMFQLTGWFSAGCWNDTVGSRTLNYPQNGLGDMTVEKCTAACKSNGYVLAGVEYGNECYCANTATNYGGLAIDGSAGCTMSCQGNSNELCGGANRLNVYKYNASVFPATSSPSSSSSAAAATTTAAAANNGNAGNTGSTTLSNVNSSATSPFTYQGCYLDNLPGGRALANQMPDNSSLTPQLCVSMCSAQGYKIAGMEYADQCFCDNYLKNNATVVSDSQCNVACAGNSSLACGAGGRLSIYSNGTMYNYTAPIINRTALANWSYQGCLTDADGARSLPYKMVFPGYNNNTGCLQLCQKFGYNAGGTEYTQECYCGDITDVANAGATIVSDAQCNMVCAADSGKNGGSLCGGPSRMTYYIWNGTTPLTNFTYATGNAAGLYQFLTSGPVIPLITVPARNGKVTYLEKFGTSPANNGTGAYEFDPTLASNYTAAWRTMNVKTDIFCSAGLTLPDRAGRQINIGGWANDATYGIRFYTPDGSPGVPGKNDWQENVNEISLLAGRWYPSAMTMANGSILVMGGEQGSNGAAVPSLEVLPSPTGQLLYCDYLDRTDPYNLYPYLSVLPSGGVFVGYYNEARVLDPVSLQTKLILPNIPGSVNAPDAGRTYPFEGTAVNMPQYPPYTNLTVMVCGGSNPGPEVALDNCASISPDTPNATWTIERMPSKRVISCIAALPDGTYLILNGAQQGRAGFGLATNPNYNAVLYDPSRPVNSRMSVMANTTIARLYHSEAVLMDDGRVLVSGSDPEDQRSFAPQEYRNEVFIPPYLMGKPARPKMNLTNLDWAYGQQVTFSVTPSSGTSLTGYRVSLMGAVSSTHGNSMGQRTYFPTTTCSGTTCTVTAPPNANVCPPAWFQVFLLDSHNIPSNATWVRIGGDPASLGNWPTYSDFSRPGIGSVTPLF